LIQATYGYGKRTPLHEYKRQRRYGGGIRTLSKELHKTGRIIGAAVVTPDDDLTLITAGGIALRTEVHTINIYGRATSGVKLMDLAEDDVLVGMAIVGSETSALRVALADDGSDLDEDLPIILDDEIEDEFEFDEDEEFNDESGDDLGLDDDYRDDDYNDEDDDYE
jgi:DNA gyrase subunit A